MKIAGSQILPSINRLERSERRVLLLEEFCKNKNFCFLGGENRNFGRECTISAVYARKAHYVRQRARYSVAPPVAMYSTNKITGFAAQK